MVAPASRMAPEVAEKVPALARSLYPDRTPEIFFHPQCFASHGHFAGDDETRAQAFLDIANDESYDAVWFARGGYGSCRMVEAVMCRLREPSRRKAYIGYSDAGVMLAALYRAGFEAVAHGPVAQDILRDGGDAAVGRARGQRSVAGGYARVVHDVSATTAQLRRGAVRDEREAALRPEEEAA